jgi:hypothetical protein
MRISALVDIMEHSPFRSLSDRQMKKAIGLAFSL